VGSGRRHTTLTPVSGYGWEGESAGGVSAWLVQNQRNSWLNEVLAAQLTTIFLGEWRTP